MTVRPSFAARTKSSPPDRMRASAGMPTVALHVGDRHAAVGPVDDHRQALAAAELGARRRAAGRRRGSPGTSGRDRHEDPVGLARRSAWLSAL